MKLEKLNNSNAQFEYVFFQPDLLVKSWEFCYDNGVQILKMKHIASDFPKDEDNDYEQMKDIIKKDIQ